MIMRSRLSAIQPMKTRIEPLTGEFRLNEFHEVQCRGKIGKGRGTEYEERGIRRPGELCQVRDRFDTKGRGTRSVMHLEHARACWQFTQGHSHAYPGVYHLVFACQAQADLCRADRARSKDAEGGTRQVEDGRLEAAGGGPAVED